VFICVSHNRNQSGNGVKDEIKTGLHNIRHEGRMRLMRSF